MNRAARLLPGVIVAAGRKRRRGRAGTPLRRGAPRASARDSEATATERAVPAKATRSESWRALGAPARGSTDECLGGRKPGLALSSGRRACRMPRADSARPSSPAKRSPPWRVEKIEPCLTGQRRDAVGPEDGERIAAQQPLNLRGNLALRLRADAPELEQRGAARRTPPRRGRRNAATRGPSKGASTHRAAIPHQPGAGGHHGGGGGACSGASWSSQFALMPRSWEIAATSPARRRPPRMYRARPARCRDARAARSDPRLALAPRGKPSGANACAVDRYDGSGEPARKRPSGSARSLERIADPNPAALAVSRHAGPSALIDQRSRNR